MINEVDPAVNRSTANGSATSFAYTFEIQDQDDLEVLVNDTVKTIGVDYSVTGVGASGGGTVVFLVAPATGSSVTRLRKQPAEQTSAYAANEAYPSARIESDFDKLVMALQQVRETLGRCLTFKKSSSTVSQAVDTPTEGLFARAKTGGGIDWATPTNASPASLPISIGNGGTGATTAAGARANLGVPTLAEAGVQADNVFRLTGSSDASKRVAFEIDGLTTGTTRTLTVQDKDATLAVTSEFDYATVAGASGRMPLPAMWLQGLTYGNNVGDATNDLDLAAGQCRDATNAHNIILSAVTKQSDVAWAVGTNAGGLDTGAVGNNDYYIWAIKRADTGVCDRLFSLSSTAPTMPTNYAYKRLIGWFKRSGGAIVPFHAYERAGGELKYLWDIVILDCSAVNPGTAAVSRVMRVPLGLQIEVIAHAEATHVNTNPGILLSDLSVTDQASASGAAPLVQGWGFNSGGGQDFAATGQVEIMTNTSGQIRSRLSSSDGNTTLYISTIGFKWARTN